MSNQDFTVNKVLAVAEIAATQVERLSAKVAEESSVSEDIKKEIELITKTAKALNESMKYLITEVLKANNAARHNYEVAAKLHESLSFYAEEENWKSSGRKKSAAAIDGGQKARLLLKGDDKNTSDE